MNNRVCLADRLMSSGIVWLPEGVNLEHAGPIARKYSKSIDAIFAKAQVVCADNVSDYFYNTGDEEFKWREFPNIRPAFQRLWVEWRIPKTCVFFDDYPIAKMAGAFIETHGEMDFRGIVKHLCSITGYEGAIASWDVVEDTQRKILAGMSEYDCDSGLVSRYTMFLLPPGDDKPVFVGEAAFVLSPKGQYLAHLEFPLKPSNPDNTQQFQRILSANLGVPMMTHSFMHCKNVALTEQLPDTKFSKAFEKKYGKPLTRYHTLEIEPMKEVLRTEGGAAHNGIKKAMHICRGHFSTYTSERPLFGKVSGTFWVPSHVRGKHENGIVAKDYSVKI